jgi:hypothetical protein
LSTDPKGLEAVACELGWKPAIRFQLSLFGSYPTVIGFSRSGAAHDFFENGTLLGRQLQKSYALYAKPRLGVVE